MVPGLNSNVARNGAVFHVQSEDLGRSKPIIQTLVYYGGEVVTVLEYTYEVLATSKSYSADEVQRMLSRQHYRMVAEIDSGVFDVVDPAAVASETDQQARQRERILDYLESALTYDRRPCPAPEGESPEEGADEPAMREATEVEPIAPPRARVEVAATAVEENMQVAASPGPSRPAVDSRGAPVADAAAPRRLVVIRPDRDGRSEREESEEGQHADIPQTVTVLHGEETPQVVAVRQTVEVKAATGHECDVKQVLGRLDETLERVNPVQGPRHSGRWLVVAATVLAFVLIAAGWRWFSRTDRTAVEPPAAQIVENVQPATPESIPVELPAAQIVENVQPATPEPTPVERPRVETEPVREAAPVPPAAPIEKPAVAVQKDLPPATSGGGAEVGSADRDETAASLTPVVPELPTGTLDPLERLEQKMRQDEVPVAAPDELTTPSPQVRPGMLVKLASVDQEPQATSRAFPKYPKRARKKGQQGPVAMSLLIDETGNVAEVRLADGVVESELSAAAMASALGWKYRPARVGSHKVRVWKPVIVHFVLDGRNRSRVRVQE